MHVPPNPMIIPPLAFIQHPRFTPPLLSVGRGVDGVSRRRWGGEGCGGASHGFIMRVACRQEARMLKGAATIALLAAYYLRTHALSRVPEPAAEDALDTLPGNKRANVQPMFLTSPAKGIARPRSPVVGPCLPCSWEPIPLQSVPLKRA